MPAGMAFHPLPCRNTIAAAASVTRLRVVRAFAFCALLMTAIPAALAQPAPLPQENITVTAIQLREMVEKFAKTFITPTKLTGKIARWDNGICPVAVGQSPQSTAFVTARVKAIAAAAGAPVSDSASCTPNIEIVFTSAPQDLLDNIRKNDPDYVGYAETSSQREKLAAVTHPIQAWYETETVDLRGTRRVDSGRRLGTGSVISNFTARGGGNRDPIYLPDATYARTTGNHINDGARSAFHHIIIAVDTKKLAGQNFVALADTIALLALAQLNSLDACQQLPSVVNITAPDCDHRVDGMTQYDLAYLEALYGISADKSLVFQQGDLTDRMEAALRRKPPAGPTAVSAPPAPPPARPSTPSAPQHETAAGNLSAGFYVKPSCARPGDVTLPKPALTDRVNIQLYNTAIRNHNKQLEIFGACVDAYTGKASLDIDWILFTVNTAIAKASNSNPPSAPAALGNMPAGFYPTPDCTKPDAPSGAAPGVRDVKALDAYNAKVKAYNAAAEVFQECLKGYAARARADVAHIEQAQVAAAQAKTP